MNDNINMDSTITGSFNVYDAEEKGDSYYKSTSSTISSSETNFILKHKFCIND